MGAPEESAELVDEIVAPGFNTDYALLSVSQRWQERPATQVLATSRPGALGMVCGSKFANIHMTVQHWSGRPPDVTEEWEDIDEVPFEPLLDAGPLLVEGFPEPGRDEPALDVSGLGRSVARVCAAGRRIADRVGDVVLLGEMDQTNERWLVQLWPDEDGGHNPMNAAPRTLKTSLQPAPTFDELDAYTGLGDPYHHAFPAMWDVLHLMFWSPDQVLRSTPLAIAHRLAVSVDHVIGGIVALVRLWRVKCNVDPQTAGPHDEIEVSR